MLELKNLGSPQECHTFWGDGLWASCFCYSKFPSRTKNNFCKKSASSSLVHRDAVWGRLSCTVGVTGCVCVNCGLCLSASVGGLLLVCVHGSGAQKKEGALTNNRGETDSRVSVRNPFIRGLPPARAICLRMFTYHQNHPPSRPDLDTSVDMMGSKTAVNRQRGFTDLRVKGVGTLR